MPTTTSVQLKMSTSQPIRVLLTFLLITCLQCIASETPQALPALATFTTYEDMQRYFALRNQRSMRYIENPTDDSYLEAFNQYNEQLEAGGQQPAVHVRTKRSRTERKLPTEPRLLKFEITDAVEPTDEVRALIRQHHSHADQTHSHSTTRAPDTSATSATTKTTQPPQKNKHTVRQKSKLKAKRSRRSVFQQYKQQPANFKVQMIPFMESDAREPDEETKQLIRRMKALDLERAQSASIDAATRTVRHSVTAAERPVPKPQPVLPSAAPSPYPIVPQQMQTRSKPFKLTIRKGKRGKRSAVEAPQTAPQMFKFELSDARAPDETLKSLMQPTREAKTLVENKEPTLLTMEAKNNQTTDKPDIQKIESRADVPLLPAQPTSQADQLIHESKRLYVYKEAPNYKTKKSINTLPHEVQKVISHLLQDKQGAKAYVKYIPAQKMDYDYLKSHYSSKYTQPVYGLKLQPTQHAHIKYEYVPKQEPTQVQIQHVPVVEKLRYVYTPVQTYAHTPQYTNAAIAQPIVVPEPQPVAHTPTEVHHTYSADLSPPPLETVEFKSLTNEAAQAIPFRASKPDPLLEENKLPEATSFVKSSLGIAHIKPIEHYKYEIYHNSAEYEKPQPPIQQTHQPVIKIEYHAPPDPLKENYKNLAEFKELSTLIGKSPDDQIHGLTYLLAKDMQNKLQRQAKRLEITERPQDRKAPILFHQVQPQVPQPNLKAHVDHAAFGSAKQYVPIVENNNEVAKASEVTTAEVAPEIKYIIKKVQAPEVPAPSSFIEYGHGLSNGYEGLEQEHKYEEPKLTTVEHVIHHPTVVQHGLVGAHKGLEAASVIDDSATTHASNSGVHYSINHNDVNKLQYASKYAFGYRIRDFHTGNDFGHKQNRDLNGVTRGQYHILLPDGRIQNVVYHADDTGFHADVSFESGH